MDGFEVPPEALDAAGAGSVVVADGVRAVDLSAPAAALAAALPGGATQRAGAQAAAGWRAQLLELGDGMRGYAAALSGSAGTYRHADRGVAAGLPNGH